MTARGGMRARERFWAGLPDPPDKHAADPNAPIGSQAWVKAYSHNVRAMILSAESAYGNIRIPLEAFRDNAYYRVLKNRRGRFFKTWGEFCEELPPHGLGISKEVANELMTGTGLHRQLIVAAGEGHFYFEEWPEGNATDVLRQVLRAGTSTLFGLSPTIIRRVLTDRLWAVVKDNSGVPFSSFKAFVEAPMWHGLESSIDDLLLFCRDQPEVQQMIRAEAASSEGIFA